MRKKVSFEAFFVNWYETVQVQLSTEIYSSFVSIQINPVIKGI